MAEMLPYLFLINGGDYMTDKEYADLASSTIFEIYVLMDNYKNVDNINKDAHELIYKIDMILENHTDTFDQMEENT